MLDTTKNNLQDNNEEIENTIDEKNTEKEQQVESDKTVNTNVPKTEEQVVSDIEEGIAELSEKKDDDEHHAIANKLPEYAKMNLEALVNEFEKLLKDFPIQKINNNVNAIKNSFNEQFSKLLAEKKAAFLAEGGESIDFSYSNPFKIRFNELSATFRTKRTKYYKDLETQLKNNLDLRFAVIEQLKDLIEHAEPKTMYNKFRDIQERWRKIGPVPREKYNGTWRTYHHHVERFYDLLHLSNDFRDLDFKHNLEEKLKLIERVEALAQNNDINYAFKQLQIIHKMWKEDIGPVAREYREDVWQKFSTATKKIHDRRHDFYKNLRGKYEENVGKKLAVIQQIENVDTSKNTNHSDWQRSIKEVEALREEFFKIGNVPKSENNKIWNKFKDATRKFNKEKNIFYKSIKSNQQENLKKKLELIALAEKFKDSEDWEVATEEMKRVQSEWKKIGHVPRKYSDKIWNEFKSACNHYFDRFHTYKNQGSKEDQELFEKKKIYLDTLVEETKAAKDLNKEKINNFVESWRALGNLPFGLKHLDIKFMKYIDKLYASISVSKDEREMIKFESFVNSLLAQNNYRKLDSEQLFLRKKIDETVREIQQLENNISFFANTKGDNPLLKNVNKNIDNYKSKLAILKSKLKYLSQLNY